MLADPEERSALISATLALEDGLSLGDPLEVQGPGEPLTVRVIGILAGDGPWAGPSGRAVVVPLAVAQAAFDETRRHPDRPRTRRRRRRDDRDRRSRGTLLRSEPYVLSSPRDLASSLRASTGDFAATTALIARDRPVRGSVPDLQHAVDDGRRAGPRARPAAGGGRDTRPADLVHPRPGVGHRRHRVGPRHRPRRRARGRDGRLDPDGRRGVSRRAGRDGPTTRSPRSSSGSS